MKLRKLLFWLFELRRIVVVVVTLFPPVFQVEAIRAFAASNRDVSV